MQVAIHDVCDPSLDLSGTGATKQFEMATLRKAISRLLARLALSPEKIKAETTLRKP